jgi:phage head maturation protease
VNHPINYDRLQPGRYVINDDGRAVRKSDAGKELVLQGCCGDYEKPFPHGDRILILKADCFEAGLRSGKDVSICIDHDESQCLGTMNEGRLQIYSGKESLVFRFLLPESPSCKFADLADDFESYVPVSLGFVTTKTDTTTVDGIEVTTVVAANLIEISILSKPPAITSTYARVASWKTCSDLQQDYDNGRFRLLGSFVSLHRKIEADGGPVSYSHATSPYERTANAFQRALKGLEND